MTKLRGAIDGKPFPPGTSGNPNGRPRKFVSTLTAQGYSKAEITATCAALLSMTIEELNAVHKDPRATTLERIVSGALYKDLAKGDMRNIETIMGRAYGAPDQKISTTVELGEKPAWLGRNKAQATKQQQTGGES